MMRSAVTPLQLAPHHEREPRWTTLTQRFRFRISRLLLRGTTQLTTKNMIPFRSQTRFRE